MNDKNDTCFWCGKVPTNDGISFHGFFFCCFECLFKSKDILEDTDKRKIEIDFLKELYEACKNIKVPQFFIFDFLEYQEKRNWEINGVKIRNHVGAFVRYSQARKARLMANGKWHGENIEDWDFTPAVGACYKAPHSNENKEMANKLVMLYYSKKPMTGDEINKAKQMGIIRER